MYRVEIMYCSKFIYKFLDILSIH